ncbi:hypothetical protein CSHISOI_03643 [Colletotrichum shisoi]|uniref:Uncharacterized protein n=1 Tax=Colletotrichum shisoi TaxID=2078593 RepID=A0A5Q4BXM7_9PEZI|nr:hypothetical protein CSHISOI_03643 [Colletotrichum shisoi]
MAPASASASVSNPDHLPRAGCPERTANTHQNQPCSLFVGVADIDRKRGLLITNDKSVQQMMTSPLRLSETRAALDTRSPSPSPSLPLCLRAQTLLPQLLHDGVILHLGHRQPPTPSRSRLRPKSQTGVGWRRSHESFCLTRRDVRVSDARVQCGPPPKSLDVHEPSVKCCFAISLPDCTSVVVVVVVVAA